ncbi:MAG TPA: hypothetical protein VGQ81_13855 [Acidobacteriota bacterium]|jgi:hypothetical protein|nr:hypothetical protein [Acidobacteriota bacterium]
MSLVCKSRWSNDIVNPPALLDPQGIGAVIAAIQNGSMFRDSTSA